VAQEIHFRKEKRNRSDRGTKEGREEKAQSDFCAGEVILFASNHAIELFLFIKIWRSVAVCWGVSETLDMIRISLI
jgi:hypothetical protein